VGLSTLPAHLSVDDALIVTVSWLLSAEEARRATATLPGANRLARWPVGPGEASRRSGYRRGQKSCGDVNVGDRLSAARRRGKMTSIWTELCHSPSKAARDLVPKKACAIQVLVDNSWPSFVSELVGASDSLFLVSLFLCN
jgi:hypothetical protein